MFLDKSRNFLEYPVDCGEDQQLCLRGVVVFNLSHVNYFEISLPEV